MTDHEVHAALILLGASFGGIFTIAIRLSQILRVLKQQGANESE